MKRALQILKRRRPVGADSSAGQKVKKQKKVGTPPTKKKVIIPFFQFFVFPWNLDVELSLLRFAIKEKCLFCGILTR